MARVFVITGPSGVGKGTLIRLLRERVPELALSVSATTRAPRPGEEDGVDYHFLSDAEFAHVIVNDRLEDALAQLTAIVRRELACAGRARPGADEQPTTIQLHQGKASET